MHEEKNHFGVFTSYVIKKNHWTEPFITLKNSTFYKNLLYDIIINILRFYLFNILLHLYYLSENVENTLFYVLDVFVMYIYVIPTRKIVIRYRISVRKSSSKTFRTKERLAFKRQLNQSNSCFGFVQWIKHGNLEQWK